MPLLREVLSESLWIACTIMFTAELMDVSELWDLIERKVEELLHLLVFGVPEVKDGLDRTDTKHKKTAKIVCIGMWPRIHFLDLQGLYVFWTDGLTFVQCDVWQSQVENVHYSYHILTTFSDFARL